MVGLSIGFFFFGTGGGGSSLTRRRNIIGDGSGISRWTKKSEYDPGNNRRGAPVLDERG